MGFGPAKPDERRERAMKRLVWLMLLLTPALVTVMLVLATALANGQGAEDGALATWPTGGRH